MKRILLIALYLAMMATTARAQFVAHYAEVYEDRPGGALKYKTWVTADGNYRQESSSGAINIFRRDSMMVYRLDPVKKTVLAMAWSQVSDPNKLFGVEIQKDKNTTSEMLGLENVEGRECEHWRYTYVTALATGRSETTVHHAWVFPPLNTWIKDAWGSLANTERQIKRNIVQGAQPAYLFEIPADYKRIAMPGGGMLEMLTGGSQGQTEQKIEGIQQRQQEGRNQMEEALDPNKSQEQQIGDMLKLIEGLKKK